jgi:hypothetical protein
MKWTIGDVTITKIVELEMTGGSRFLLPQATPAGRAARAVSSRARPAKSSINLTCDEAIDFALGSGLNLGPPDDHGGERDGGAKIPGQLIVSHGDAPPILQVREGPFDQVA